MKPEGKKKKTPRQYSDSLKVMPDSMPELGFELFTFLIEIWLILAGFLLPCGGMRPLAARHDITQFMKNSWGGWRWPASLMNGAWEHRPRLNHAPLMDAPESVPIWWLTGNIL